MWSPKHKLSKCTQCNSNEKKHHSGGLCSLCYERSRNKWEKIKNNPVLHEKHKKRSAKRARDKRKQNPKVLDRERLQCKKWYEKNKEYRSQYYKKYYQDKRFYHLFRVRIREYGENYLLALERDNFKCVGCGAMAYGIRRLHIHHKDGLGSQVNKDIRNNSLNNLETLCALCHRKKDAKRKKT